MAANCQKMPCEAELSHLADETRPDQNGGDSNCTWSVRRGLRSAILQRRQAAGKSDLSQLDNSDTTQSKEYKLTPRELQLREMRKRNNRAAALKWRKRRKDFNDHLSQLLDLEEKRKKLLMYKHHQLVTEKAYLEATWRGVDRANRSGHVTQGEQPKTEPDTPEADMTSSQSSVDSAMSLSRQTSQSDGPSSLGSEGSAGYSSMERSLSFEDAVDSGDDTSSQDETKDGSLESVAFKQEPQWCDSGNETDSQG